jgi:uncharacterized protein YecT (DUF1311 family)
MKTTVFALALLIALPLSGDNVTSRRLVDLDTGKAVVFEETVSPDGNYAIGWTIQPRHKEAKLVDWSLWNPDDTDKLVGTYLPNYSDPPTDKDDYELVNGVIDLKGKKFLELPTDNPDYPHKNRGFVVAAWGPVDQKTRYAVVESDARFSTENLWVVTIDSSGMHQVDWADAFDKAVAPVVRDKRPLNFAQYGNFFSLLDDGQPQKVDVEFKGGLATISFQSDIPKSDDDTSMVEGKLTFRLSDGKVLQVVSKTEKDDPMASTPGLAKADRELNQVYSQLSQKLDPAQKADLKKEQLAWIDQRDDDAAEALRKSSDDPSAHDPHDARNKSLLESTQKRLAELRARLEALH